MEVPLRSVMTFPVELRMEVLRKPSLLPNVS